MSIEFFCKDAREIFLSPNSVDLFITHIPYHRTNVTNYINSKNLGDLSVDLSLQLQENHSVENYVDSVVRTVNHMDYSLKDNGSIILVCPNGPKTFKIISKIIQDTNLFVNRLLFWNFAESLGIKSQQGNAAALIFHLTYLSNIPYTINNFESFVINKGFGPSKEDIKKYGHLGFMSDSMPNEVADLLVLGFSKEGDVVADILGGTGSVAVSALKNNRKTIYNDSSIEQLELAKKRISDIIEEIKKEI